MGKYSVKPWKPLPALYLSFIHTMVPDKVNNWLCEKTSSEKHSVCRVFALSSTTAHQRGCLLACAKLFADGS